MRLNARGTSHSVAACDQRSQGISQMTAPTITATRASATSAGRFTAGGAGMTGAVMPTSAPHETKSAPARRPAIRG